MTCCTERLSHDNRAPLFPTFSVLLWRRIDDNYTNRSDKVTTERGKYNIQKTVRLPERIYKRLEAEALQSGVGQPAVQARNLIINRLQKGELGGYIAFASKKIHMAADEPRMNIRLSKKNMELVDPVLQLAPGITFSALARAILIERFDEPPQEKPEMAVSRVALASSAEVFGIILDVIKRTLASGEDVKITDFGVFEIRQHSERKARNPRTGEAVIAQAKNVVAFVPYKALRDAVQEGK